MGYRRPLVKDGEIKLQRGKIDGEVDMCIFYGDNIPRADRALMFSYICSENFNYSGGERLSLIKELEIRGYDLDTLKISIKKKDEYLK
jgi:hypothetical protein